MPSWVDELAIKLGASRVGPVHSAGNAFRLGTGVVRRVAEASEPKLTVLHLLHGVTPIDSSVPCSVVTEQTEAVALAISQRAWKEFRAVKLLGSIGASGLVAQQLGRNNIH